MSTPTTKRAALPAKTTVTRSVKTALISGAVPRVRAVAAKPVVARKPAVRAGVPTPVAKKLLVRPKPKAIAPSAVPSRAVIDKATTAAKTATTPRAKARPRSVAVAKIITPEVPVKVAALEIANAPESTKKPKLVRDSFTIPKIEYAVLQSLKQRAAKLTTGAKKSELLRAGIKALAAMPDAAFLNALKQVPAIRTGHTAAS